MDTTFQDVYNEFHEKIRHFIGWLVGQADAEDVTQEVFVKVYKGLKTFKGGSKFSTWIYQIATKRRWTGCAVHGTASAVGRSPLAGKPGSRKWSWRIMTLAQLRGD